MMTTSRSSRLMVWKANERLLLRFLMLPSQKTTIARTTRMRTTTTTPSIAPPTQEQIRTPASTLPRTLFPSNFAPCPNSPVSSPTRASSQCRQILGLSTTVRGLGISSLLRRSISTSIRVGHCMWRGSMMLHLLSIVVRLVPKWITRSRSLMSCRLTWWRPRLVLEIGLSRRKRVTFSSRLKMRVLEMRAVLQQTKTHTSPSSKPHCLPSPQVYRHRRCWNLYMITTANPVERPHTKAAQAQRPSVVAFSNASHRPRNRSQNVDRSSSFCVLAVVETKFGVSVRPRCAVRICGLMSTGRQMRTRRLLCSMTSLLQNPTLPDRSVWATSQSPRRTNLKAWHPRLISATNHLWPSMKDTCRSLAMTVVFLPPPENSISTASARLKKTKDTSTSARRTLLAITPNRR